MSGRKLGGGRVLGSGRSLSPAVAAVAASTAAVPKPPAATLLSPSASSVSLNSSASTEHTSTEHQDITSRVSWENHAPANAAAAAATTARLACPICNEEMVGGAFSSVQRS